MSRLPLLDADDLLDAAKRIAASYQVQGWSGRDGEEAYETIATVLAAVLARIVCRAEGRYLERATGVTGATGSVRVTWSAGTGDGVGIKAGQVLTKTPWGIRYMLTEELAIGDAAAPGEAVLVAVEQVLGSCEGNLWDPEHCDTWALPTGPTASGSIAWVDGQGEDGKTEFLAGVDDGTITVLGEGTFEGGTEASLDLIAQGRGLPRAENEADSQLRARIRVIPPMITPNAIAQAVRDATWALGITFTIVEPWNYAWTVGDDPLGTIGDEGWSPIDHRPAFVVLLEDVPYADTAWTVGDDPLGTIGDEYPIGVPHETHDAIIAGVQELIDRIKAFGVDGRVSEDLLS